MMTKFFSGTDSLSNVGNVLANYAGNRTGLLGGYNAAKDSFGQAQNPFAQFAPVDNTSTDSSTEDDEGKTKALNTDVKSNNLIANMPVQTTPQPIAPNSAPQKSSGIGSLLGMLLAAV